MDEGDFVWEDPVKCEDKEEVYDMFEDNMEEVDGCADEEEIQRLLEMGVLEKSDEPGGLFLSTKLVRDWRFRDQQWKIRSRLVARELKVWDPKREDLFSPASSPAVLRLAPRMFCTGKAQQKDSCYV